MLVATIIVAMDGTASMIAPDFRAMNNKHYACVLIAIQTAISMTNYIQYGG